MILPILLSLSLLLLFLWIDCVIDRRRLRANHKNALIEVGISKERVEELESAHRKLLHQKKSSEVKTGLIVEAMAPFMEGFPADPKTAHFLGKPIDFVCFQDQDIVFVEVKSGGSQLTKTQRKVKELIESGNVRFEVYRMKG